MFGKQQSLPQWGVIFLWSFAVLVSGYVLWLGLSPGKPPIVPSVPTVSTSKPPAVSFRIASLEEKNYPNDFEGGVQLRWVRVTVKNYTTKQEVEDIARRVYESFRTEIEGLDPDAKHKNIGVLVYDDIVNANEHIYTLSTDDGYKQLPPATSLEVKWMYWRLPAYRPSDKQIALEREYMAGLEAASEASQVPWTGGQEEMLKAGKIQSQRRRVRIAVLVEEMKARHSMSEDALARDLAYAWTWKHGLVPSDEIVGRQIKSYMEEWSPLPPE